MQTETKEEYYEADQSISIAETHFFIIAQLSVCKALSCGFLNSVA
jgi:hypothetical protein